MSFPSQSHYRTLNVSQNAKLHEITAAYLALKQKCQAELSPNADATRFLNAIDTAYAVLSDPSQRAKYDQALHEQDAGHPSTNQSATATRQAPPIQARANSIASQIASNTPAETEAETKKHGGIRWLGLASLGLAVIAGMLWYVFADQIASRDESMAEAQAEVSATDSAESTMTSASTADGIRETGDNTVPGSKDVTELTALAYDPAPIEQFVGSWKGLGEPGAQKALEISLKSGSSLVFSLKTKAGNNIGDIVGVAEFDNGSARFFNEEYGCKLVFTRSAEILNVTTGGCQAYHQQGAEFDGSYAKPLAPKPASTKSTAKNTETKNIGAARNETPPQVAIAQEKPPAANPGKLYRFVATVKNAEGKNERIELVAANEEAARAILRDFRGNPTVVRIRRAWF